MEIPSIGAFFNSVQWKNVAQPMGLAHCFIPYEQALAHLHTARTPHLPLLSLNVLEQVCPENPNAAWPLVRKMLEANSFQVETDTAEEQALLDRYMSHRSVIAHSPGQYYWNLVLLDVRDWPKRIPFSLLGLCKMPVNYETGYELWRVYHECPEATRDLAFLIIIKVNCATIGPTPTDAPIDPQGFCGNRSDSHVGFYQRIWNFCKSFLTRVRDSHYHLYSGKRRKIDNTYNHRDFARYWKTLLRNEGLLKERHGLSTRGITSCLQLVGRFIWFRILLDLAKCYKSEAERTRISFTLDDE